MSYFTNPAIENSVSKQMAEIEDKIRNYVNQVLGMILPEDYTEEEYQNASRIVYDFTSLSVYKKQLEKIYAQSYAAINGADFGESMSVVKDYLDVNQVYQLLSRTKPTDLRKGAVRGPLKLGDCSRYPSKLENRYRLFNNPNHRSLITKYGRSKIQAPLSAEDVDAYLNDTFQIEPIMMLRDLFYSGGSFDSMSDFFIGNKDYNDFYYKGLMHLKNQFKIALTSLEEYRNDNSSPYGLYTFIKAFEGGITGRNVNISEDIAITYSKGKSALCDLAIRNSSKTYDAEQNYMKVYQSVVDKYRWAFQEIPSGRKEREEFERAFNEQVIQDITNNSNTKINTDRLLEDLSKFQKKVYRCVRLGAYPLTESPRKKDHIKLEKTMLHQGKVFDRINGGLDQKNHFMIFITSALAFAASTYIYISTPSAEPSLPLATGVITPLLLNNISHWYNSKMCTDKIKAQKDMYSMTNIGRLLTEFKLSLYDFLHTPRKQEVGETPSAYEDAPAPRNKSIQQILKELGESSKKLEDNRHAFQKHLGQSTHSRLYPSEHQSSGFNPEAFRQWGQVSIRDTEKRKNININTEQPELPYVLNPYGLPYNPDHSMTPIKPQGITPDLMVGPFWENGLSARESYEKSKNDPTQEYHKVSSEKTDSAPKRRRRSDRYNKVPGTEEHEGSEITDNGQTKRLPPIEKWRDNRDSR